MTNEEAVEEVLKGPFSDCVRCKGTGIRETTTLTALGVEFVLEKHSCEGCNGLGKWERGDYKQACIIVGIEPLRLPTMVRVTDARFWNRAITPQEVADFFNQGVEKSRQEALFRKEYMGNWEFTGKDDEVKFERDDTAEAAAFSISCTLPVKP